jgi:hypothetical protein
MKAFSCFARTSRIFSVLLFSPFHLSYLNFILTTLQLFSSKVQLSPVDGDEPVVKYFHTPPN